MHKLFAVAGRFPVIFSAAKLYEPSYNEPLAETLAKMGMPCFGCTPERLPELLAGVLRGHDLKALATKLGVSDK